MKEKSLKIIGLLVFLSLLFMLFGCDKDEKVIANTDNNNSIENTQAIIYGDEDNYDFGDRGHNIEINKDNINDFLYQINICNPSKVYINVKYIDDELINSLKNVNWLEIEFNNCDFSSIGNSNQDLDNLNAENLYIDFSYENIFSENIYQFIECFKNANYIDIDVVDDNVANKFDINKINFSESLLDLYIHFENNNNYFDKVDFRKYNNLFSLYITGNYQEVWLPSFKQNMWSYVVDSSKPCIIHVSDNFLDIYVDNFDNLSYGNGPAIFVDSSNNVLCIGDKKIMFVKTYKDDLFNKYPSLYDYLDDPVIASIYDCEYFWRGQHHFIGVRNPDDYTDDVLYQLTCEPSYIMNDELYASVVNYLENLPIYYNLY